MLTVHRSVSRRYRSRTLIGVPHVTAPTPRQRLIAAASDLFYRQGVGAVGVDLVSKAAGVSKRTLYLQFGSKDELVAQSLDAMGPAVIGTWLPAEPDSELPARQRILAVFERLSAWTAAAEFRGCPFINTATELADPGHPARRVARDYKQRLHGYFADQAGRAGAEDPPRLADQLIIVFDGAIVQAVMGIAVRPDSIQAMVRALLDAQGIR
jgi:AcrR family transcriptional regulator